MANWLTISNLIYTTLSTHSALTTLLSNGADSIYPLVAEAKEDYPFITYAASYESTPSKDGVFTYSIAVFSFAESYNDAVNIADKVNDAIVASSDVFIIQSGQPVVTDENQFYIQQTFNIKK
jgi:hypothetical protein